MSSRAFDLWADEDENSGLSHISTISIFPFPEEIGIMSSDFSIFPPDSRPPILQFTLRQGDPWAPLGRAAGVFQQPHYPLFPRDNNGIWRTQRHAERAAIRSEQ